MESWGEYNDRQLFYLPTRQNINWADELPTSDWLAIVVGDTRDIALYSEVADKCIAKNVSYVCTLGLACELIHDIFDEEIVEKKIQNGDSTESEDDFEDSLMTDWHNDFEEGVWFAIIAANDDTKYIDKVVCIDLTDTIERQRLFELIEKIKTGYIPPD
jgi:hypothetical protein